MITIRPCRDNDRAAILAIVNAAAEAYRGVIPPDRWHEPYMPEDELDGEIAAGVVFWGYEEDGRLLGVMGLQSVRDVDLIRHAYTVPDRQRARHRRRPAGASAAAEHAAYPDRHLGGCRLGDPLLPAARLRAGRACAQGRAPRDLLEHPGATDRDFGGAGKSPGRRCVTWRPADSRKAPADVSLGAAHRTRGGHMARIAIIDRADMNAEQARVYDAAKASGGPVGGPYYAYIRLPKLFEASQNMRACLSAGPLSRREQQIVNLAVARHWNARYPWYAQVRNSLSIGIEQAVVDAINARGTPGFGRCARAHLLRRGARAPRQQGAERRDLCRSGEDDRNPRAWWRWSRPSAVFP